LGLSDALFEKPCKDCLGGEEKCEFSDADCFWFRMACEALRREFGFGTVEKYCSRIPLSPTGNTIAEEIGQGSSMEGYVKSLGPWLGRMLWEELHRKRGEEGC